MRVGNLQPTRPFYYDRNGTERMGYFQLGSTGPHALTTRYSYTVPGGKKFNFEYGYVLYVRFSVSATVNGVQMLHNMSIQGASAIIMQQEFYLSNNVGDERRVEGSDLGVYLASDVLTGQTADVNIGGAGFYFMGFKGIEFDA